MESNYTTEKEFDDKKVEPKENLIAELEEKMVVMIENKKMNNGADRR